MGEKISLVDLQGKCSLDMGRESEEYRLLGKVNDFAKPGGHYELSIGEEGYVEWEPFGTEGYDPRPDRVTVQFRPGASGAYGVLDIEVPSGIRVNVRKLTIV